MDTASSQPAAAPSATRMGITSGAAGGRKDATSATALRGSPVATMAVT
ncbi:MAG: hypothetical protein M3024_16335 [Candidatus Dormibacteraeota bacterium]|nr:hypothetical protein [Candidatus Dormibacteraeota bacterium]MDQ6909240.1 hypothetical protein [Actinomycetota bacterium]